MLTILLSVSVSKRLCSEIGFRVKKRRQIAAEYGIRNLDDLLHLKSRLGNGELRSMAEEIKQKLLLAAVWRRRNPEVNVMEDFDEDVWDDWVKSFKDDGDRMDAEVNVSLLSEDDGDRMDAEMNVSLFSVESSHLSLTLNSNSFACSLSYFVFCSLENL